MSDAMEEFKKLDLVRDNYNNTVLLLRKSKSNNDQWYGYCVDTEMHDYWHIDNLIQALQSNPDGFVMVPIGGQLRR